MRLWGKDWNVISEVRTEMLSASLSYVLFFPHSLSSLSLSLSKKKLYIYIYTMYEKKNLALGVAIRLLCLSYLLFSLTHSLFSLTQKKNLALRGRGEGDDVMVWRLWRRGACDEASLSLSLSLSCSLWGSSVCAGHDPFVCVGHDLLVRGTWLIRMWDMTHSYVGHDSPSWCLGVVYVGHDSFVGGTWLPLVIFGGRPCMFHTTRLYV